ncbi:MAG: S8 family serine peptidase, partial [Bacteroidetes bacterium]|nr:S8 family serine peptidase [Fibrella sp.]
GMYGPATSPANQFGSNAAAAWAAGQTGSATVYVGVIDEGVQVTHPDLSANIWVNPFDPVDGVDNDGNGYRDDRNGWDFAANNNTVYDGGNNGRYDDHGTHVAGTIGGKGGNGVGVAGVTWTVKMISTKFLGAQGGTSANAVRAVDYLTDLKLRHGLNIVASNNSWGGGGYSQALFDAINRANNAGILFIAAAGNGGSDGVGDNNDALASYPANYNLPNVISVAAITSAGNKSSFSNFGATTVDIGAPGSGVWSSTAFNTYSSYNGTSMATPHVTGAAALYASVKPGATAAQIKNAILSSAVPTPSLSGRVVTNGRLDANAALSR